MIDSINGYTPINQSQNPANSKTENIENAELFKELLGKAFKGNAGEGAGGIQGTGLAQKSRAADLLSEISSINNINLNNPLSEVESRTDELIDKLSLYSSKLEDSRVSLKDMDSLLEEINSSAGNLLKDAEDSGDTEKELMDIVRECAIAAHSEYIKFQRGDYLDSLA